MLEKVLNRRIEMIWFGGIHQELSNCVFQVTLKLDFVEATPGVEDDRVEVKNGHLLVKKLRNDSGKLAQLKKPDRFFYNQEFYL